ncbi:substrate-binding domain-containing protein [Novosphingobium sp. Gsoil 351]|uniref:substrate-binding domain-containing protein n=1 Tax=Novosphingobium sp. Gsoil 351 TaxID=2675225 RepID=UPI0012B4AEE5|nr:substrate-binding domain-containing protein [Novosphingobium sp. Gsoil 351]QGN55001.1 LacI family DNA-binding transcriptional regulator [Novosphingobium sp. Gsoil 351]
MNKPGDPAERPTMERVAELAGVSKITVSRALRGSELVRPEVRERVTRVAKQIGYRVNVAARSLRTRRSRTIAVVIEQLDRGDRPIADPLLLAMIGGLLEALTPADYAMLLTTNEHFLAASAMGADGVVMLGEGEGGHRLAQIEAFGLPMVAWGEPVSGVKIPVVGSANHAGGRLAAEHLVAKGRSRMLFLGDNQHPEVAARLAGCREVLASSAAMLAGVLPCAFTAEAGARAVGAAIAGGTAFDAIFAASDFIAAGASDELATRGFTVPRDVAVVGFDDAPIASAHRPPLSSIRQDGAAAGRALGRAIVGLVEGTADGSSEQLPVELVVRESSG